MRIFNPMITKKVRRTLIICFLGLFILNSLILAVGYVLEETFVIKNDYAVIVFLLLITFFVFKGYGSFKYFLGVYILINFIVLFIMTLVPIDMNGAIIESELHFLNQWTDTGKMILYIVFNMLQISLITPIFKNKSIQEYFELAEKERKGRIVKG